MREAQQGKLSKATKQCPASHPLHDKAANQYKTKSRCTESSLEQNSLEDHSKTLQSELPCTLAIMYLMHTFKFRPASDIVIRLTKHGCWESPVVPGALSLSMPNDMPKPAMILVGATMQALMLCLSSNRGTAILKLDMTLEQAATCLATLSHETLK